ncbi:MAG: hypothetical protein L3J54_02875 [Draconibacterium sp.]|nr:hypothetical protein [Draconibacterium sp.]
MINQSKKLTTLILILFLILFFEISGQANNFYKTFSISFHETEPEEIAKNYNSNKQNNVVPDSSSKKLRVIHTTDMGFDNKNSLVRMLLFANEQNIIGIKFI